jgi:peptide/nickel transport system substrate-binding protein
VLFQNSAKAAGIDVKVVREPNDGYWSDVWMKKGFVFSYWGGRPVEDQMFSTAYTCGASWNESYWCNDRFEELLVKARSELDEAKRKEMYFEMQELCSNDGGSVIPMFANYVFATNKTIATPEAMGSNWDLDGSRWTERWWFA